MIKYLTALCLCFIPLAACHWISVTERFPLECGHKYFFRIDVNTIVVATYVDFYMGDRILCTDGENWYLATDWMEIPE